MKRNKIIVAVLMVLMLVGMFALTAAAETAGLDTGISSAISNGVAQVKSDFGGILAIVLPIALGIGGLGIAIKLGWGFFKKIGH